MKFFLLRISPNASAPYFKKSYTLKKKLARVRDVADRYPPCQIPLMLFIH